jgi:poly-gamma-glutamate synthase PgsB/CapB
MLQQEGIRTCGKVTGTNAKFIAPDGTESAIVRKSPATILEQKTVLKRAVGLKAEAIVSEIMSITPEYQYTETKRFFNPTHLIISNARADHLNVTATTVTGIGKVFLDSAPKGCSVVSYHSFFENYPENSTDQMRVEVDPDSYAFDPTDFSYPEFRENYELAATCVGELLSNKIIMERVRLRTPPTDIDNISMKALRPDFGILKVWQKDKVVYISAFAANDPDSTERVLERLIRDFQFEINKCIGVCNLRMDKGERSLQWLEQWKQKGIPFKKLYLVGGHSRVVAKRLRSSKVVDYERPTPERIIELCENEAIKFVFGFGNIKGFGMRFVTHLDSNPNEFKSLSVTANGASTK